MSFRIGVHAIIFDDQGRVLLCHRRDHDLWNLPGGGLEPGEAPWHGVLREVKEETGLEARVVRLAGIYSKPEVNEVVFSFLCEIVAGTPAATEEADRVEFLPPDSLPPNTLPKQVERIHDALACSDQVVMKVQGGKSSADLIREGNL